MDDVPLLPFGVIALTARHRYVLLQRLLPTRRCRLAELVMACERLRQADGGEHRQRSDVLLLPVYIGLCLSTDALYSHRRF
ncbi:hypothetical protein F2P81_005062 [Scophthalmus maximus]|uniref:Uncharacterized protein n=1 Tax=Scophthalmus maximus TaxID=52904 RepID=A0A6A4TET4_SCOMX|nr:hypothetical protein F2P81_005062 [Scophthalmus maximus]